MNSSTFKDDRHLIAVTGAQGVGKSTFCEKLAVALQERAQKTVRLMAGLGQRLTAIGVPLGSNSGLNTIPVVFAAHLERQLEAANSIVIFDRCVVDALAYTRCLHLVDAFQLRLYEAVAALSAREISLMVHLRLTPFFETKGKPHEEPELRLQVSREIPKILNALARPTINLDASNGDAITDAVNAILQAIRRL